MENSSSDAPEVKYDAHHTSSLNSPALSDLSSPVKRQKQVESGELVCPFEFQATLLLETQPWWLLSLIPRDIITLSFPSSLLCRVYKLVSFHLGHTFFLRCYELFGPLLFILDLLVQVELHSYQGPSNFSNNAVLNII